MYPFIDFFGRVKDKAGDVERILKEKDRHGTVFISAICFTILFTYENSFNHKVCINI